MKKHTSAGCYVLRKNNEKYELLVIHRKYPEGIDPNKKGNIEGNDAYVMPKGHKKEGETLEEAALRETREETGFVDIEIVIPLGSMNYVLPWDPPIDKTDHYFLAILKSGKKTSRELTDWEEESGMSIEWKPLEEGVSLLTWENDHEFPEKIMKFTSNNL